MRAMTDDIMIRPATLADAAAISAVHRSTVDVWRDPVTRQPVAYADLDGFGRWFNGGPWMSLDLCAAHLESLLRRGHLPLVAEVDNDIVGEAEYFIDREARPPGARLHLSILYVHGTWQRQGIGHRLINAGIAAATTRGLTGITTQPETEAIGFYRRTGFRPWLRAKEMQINAQGDMPDTLMPVSANAGVPEHLSMRIGRYQCSAQGWDVFWPSLPLRELAQLRRSLWCGELDGTPVVLGIREQLLDPTQADGYAWLPPTAPLAPAVDALRALGAREGFHAVDLLLPEDALPTLKATFRLNYQTTVDLWIKKT